MHALRLIPYALIRMTRWDYVSLAFMCAWVSFIAWFDFRNR